MSVVCLVLVKTISGHIKALCEKTIVVQSDTGRTYSVAIDGKTRFVKSNPRSRAKGPKSRDDVWLEVEETEGKLVALEIRYGRPRSRKPPASDLATDNSTIEHVICVAGKRKSNSGRD